MGNGSLVVTNAWYRVTIRWFPGAFTSMIFACATISNDNLQDLKTGQLVGASPMRPWLGFVGAIVWLYGWMAPKAGGGREAVAGSVTRKELAPTWPLRFLLPFDALDGCNHLDHMTTWLSLSDLVRDLALHVDPGDRDAIRAQIRREVDGIHPDRNGGVLSDNSAEARYHKLMAALEFLEKPPSTALVPIQDIPALVAAIKQVMEPADARTTPAHARAEFRDVVRTELRQRMFLPRIGSGVFAAACAFLLTVGDKFANDPVVGEWLTSSTGRLFILAGLAYSAVLFVATAYARLVNVRLGGHHTARIVSLCGHNARCILTSEAALRILFQ
jgi:hypothetical protein